MQVKSWLWIACLFLVGDSESAKISVLEWQLDDYLFFSEGKVSNGGVHKWFTKKIPDDVDTLYINFFPSLFSYFFKGISSTRLSRFLNWHQKMYELAGKGTVAGGGSKYSTHLMDK